MKVIETKEIELPDLPEGYVYLGRGGEFEKKERFEGLYIGPHEYHMGKGWVSGIHFSGSEADSFYAAPEDSEVAILNGKARMTAKKWLKTLPDGYRERALRAFKNKKSLDHVKGRLHNSLALALITGPCWDSSEEGIKFWDDCYYAIRDKKELPPLPDEKKYWSKPSDFPPVCWLYKEDSQSPKALSGFDFSGDNLEFIRGTANWALSLPVSELTKFRWSDRPFDKFEDGKECLVEN